MAYPQTLTVTKMFAHFLCQITTHGKPALSEEILAIYRQHFEICRYKFECLLNGGSYSTEILRALSLEIGSFSFHFTILVETSPINLRL